MDKTTAAVIGLALLVVAFIAFFFIFRKGGKGKIKGLFGMGLEVKGDNATPPAVQVTDVTSRTGSLTAEDRTGNGAAVTRADVAGDIRVSSTPPGNPPPKP